MAITIFLDLSISVKLIEIDRVDQFQKFIEILIIDFHNMKIDKKSWTIKFDDSC